VTAAEVGGRPVPVSVVIVTYNSAPVLERCLTSVSEHLPAAEILVVDNGSDDECVAIARGHPGARVIAGHGNVGFGAGVNHGARAASGRLLLVLNPDAVITAVDRDRLAALQGAAVTGLQGCRVVHGGGFRYLIAPLWSWRAEMRWSFVRWFLIPREVSVPRPSALVRREGSWITGAAFLARREELLGAGGFDERLFLYFEDFDLCRAYRDRGLPVSTTDAVTVEHEGMSSSPRVENRMIGFALLSLIQYVSKWDGPAAAAGAAVTCLRLLERIDATGRRAGPFPLLGPRARKKAASAAEIRAMLERAVGEAPVPGTYPGAREAIREALR
jgi:N-acetylglucosaminyl-diphospho-decaprenol L-rhamnosyltransferase